MAARSTHVTLLNTTRLNLRRTNHELDHGIWTEQPPQIIGDRGEWASESSGILTGTEGRASFNIEDLDERVVGSLNVHWDNPFVGSNSYSESVSPHATNPDVDGFTILHVGGDGNDAHVKFQLSAGFCEVNNETGEISCSSISRLTGATERYAAIWEQSLAPAWHARHGISAAEYQQTFDGLVAHGFRPLDVSGYEADGQDRYAAIFEQREGPPFAARHGLSADDYQRAFDELVGQGFRPIHVNGYGIGGRDRYAAIFEQRDGPPFVARHGLSADDYQRAFDELVGQGFRPVKVSGYAVDGQDRFAAIFEQREGPPFVARHGISGDEYQRTFDDLVGQGFRLVDVSGYGIGGRDRYAAIFEQREGPPFAARHGLGAADYQRVFDELVGQGFRLVLVSGYSLG